MRIRLARPEDAHAIRGIYAPIVENTVVSFEEDPPSEAEMADRIAGTLPEYPWLVCERPEERESDHGGGDDDRKWKIAGYAYAGRHRKRDAYRWSVDVSVYVADDHRREGVGRSLYESLFAVLRLQGFVTAYAGIALPNPASVALHEAMGFEQVGVYESVGYKRGAWRDVGWWQLRLRERPERPETPRSVAEIEESDAFAAALSAGESPRRA